MKIIYHCYGGAHSSVTAAFVHLGRLPEDRPPSPKELVSLPLFDRQEAGDHGRLIFLGSDEMGNQIYLVGRRGRAEVLEGVFSGLTAIFGIADGDYLLVDVMGSVNLAMMFGGYLSRRLGWELVGRPLVAFGTRAAYWKIVKTVHAVKEYLKNGCQEGDVFQRKFPAAFVFGRRSPHWSSSAGKT